MYVYVCACAHVCVYIKVKCLSTFMRLRGAISQKDVIFNMKVKYLVLKATVLTGFYGESHLAKQKCSSV
jgi:hypothetical protein